MDTKLGRGNSYDRILFEDDQIILTEYCGTIEVYVNTEYRTPLCARLTTSFLSCGTWKRQENRFYKYDECRGRTGITADCIEDIVRIEKKKRNI